MIDKISSDALLQHAERLQQSVEINEAAQPADKDGEFGKVLGNLIDDVDQAQKAADVSLKKLATGETTNIQDVVLKLEEADISFKMMKEIRDKLLAAYKEVISMS